MDKIFDRIFIRSSTNPLIQFARYAVVGGIASAADVFVFAFFANRLGVNYLISNIAAFTAGLLVNYFLSRSWVFNGGGRSFGRDFPLFAAIGAAGLALSSLLLFIMIDLKVLATLAGFFLNVTHPDAIKLVAKLIAVFLVLFWNFAARRKVVFNV